MKYEKLEKRRSFRKFAMPNQRVETMVSEKLNYRREKALGEGRLTAVGNIGKNNGPLKHSVPAKNRSTLFSLAKHSCVNDPAGRSAKRIPSYDYHPEPKAPSRRDRHRAEVRECAVRG